eukprot:jgi/Bigna1/135371/aug1.29_g10079
MARVKSTRKPRKNKKIGGKIKEKRPKSTIIRPLIHMGFKLEDICRAINKVPDLDPTVQTVLGELIRVHDERERKSLEERSDNKIFQPTPELIRKKSSEILEQNTKHREAKSSKDQNNDAGKPKTCKVCFEEIKSVDDNQTFTNGMRAELPSCGHYFHKKCWRGYLKDKLESQIIAKEVTCIMNNCDRKLYVGNKMFDKYKNFVKQARLRADPNVRWCPNPKCSKPIHGDGGGHGEGEGEGDDKCVYKSIPFPAKNKSTSTTISVCLKAPCLTLFGVQ